MVKPAKNTICLWYDSDAEEANDGVQTQTGAIGSE